jgi:hypothetical protein
MKSEEKNGISFLKFANNWMLIILFVGNIIHIIFEDENFLLIQEKQQKKSNYSCALIFNIQIKLCSINLI